MYPHFDFVRDILILTVAPLLFSILFFRWFLRLSNNLRTHKDLVVACFLSGGSFIIFQIVQSTLVIGWGYVDYHFNTGFVNVKLRDLYDLIREISGLVMIRGPIESWIQVANYLFEGIPLLSELFPPVVQMIYFLFYSSVGLVVIAGAKLWIGRLPVKIFGTIILGVSFLVYTIGLYFWMVTAMYL